ncbi:hypothetical protein [Helicobacter rodentium]|uniref:hypothetical protein n=1 Tax=Helicobacter rodentium TaxID=59617 RepID=UPI002353A37E|nr:hypothetical protein [Helicobacter rodentium]
MCIKLLVNPIISELQGKILEFLQKSKMGEKVLMILFESKREKRILKFLLKCNLRQQKLLSNNTSFLKEHK